jgi:hypothetical protein
MEPYPSGQFGFIDDPDRQFGNGSVWTRTRTRSDGPEPLLTLVGHNATVFVYNRIPTEREETAKLQVEGDMQHAA